MGEVLNVTQIIFLSVDVLSDAFPAIRLLFQTALRPNRDSSSRRHSHAHLHRDRRLDDWLAGSCVTDF